MLYKHGHVGTHCKIVGRFGHKSSFISPGKRGTNTLFDDLQFVTPFTYVSRYPGGWNRKQNKKWVEKNCSDYEVSDL